MRKTMGCLGAAAALTLGAAVVAAPGAASAVTPTPATVTFTGEAPGFHPNGYFAAAQPHVRFRDTLHSGVFVSEVGQSTNGQGLVSESNTVSGIEIRLTGPTTAISLAFGYDLGDATDQAQLTLYRGAVQVAQVETNVNANEVMDQRIGYHDGRLFNRAVFRYVDGAGVPKNAWEVIDDVTVAPICTIAGNSGHNLLRGTSHRDVICGDTGNDIIAGEGGNDLVYPGPGADRTSGGRGSDTILDIAGNDRLSGNDGHDDLRAGIGRDALSGGTGNDRLNGGLHRDVCRGDSGRDAARACEVRRRIP